MKDERNGRTFWDFLSENDHLAFMAVLFAPFIVMALGMAVKGIIEIVRTTP